MYVFDLQLLTFYHFRQKLLGIIFACYEYIFRFGVHTYLRNHNNPRTTQYDVNLYVN